MLRCWELFFLNQALFKAIYKSRKKSSKLSNNETPFLDIVDVVLPANANREYKHICNKLLQFVFEIPIEVKSVNSKYIKYEYDTNERKTYDLLSKIPLKDHLVRCFINCAYMYKDKKPVNFITLLCAMSLAHDIGKIPNLEIPFLRMQEHTHEELSAAFLEHFFEGDIKAEIVNNETIVLMQNVIRKHHVKKQNKLTANPSLKEVLNDYAACLIDVDANTREMEIAILSETRKETSCAEES